MVVYLPCWFAVSSLWRHFAFILSNSHLQRLMRGCFCCDPFVNPLVPRGGSQQLGFPTSPTLEQSGSNVFALVTDEYLLFTKEAIQRWAPGSFASVVILIFSLSCHATGQAVSFESSLFCPSAGAVSLYNQINIYFQYLSLSSGTIIIFEDWVSG